MDLSLSVLSPIIHVLEEKGIEYAVVGSFASSIHGMYRATADIDILVNISSEQIKPLFESLRGTFYVDEQAIRQAVAQRGSFNAIHLESVFKVDFFIAGSDEFAKSQLERRQPKQLPSLADKSLYVATAEDTILAKLNWFRSGNEVSSSQWTDICGILRATRKQLDLDYLKSWASKLGLSDLLEKAQHETQ